MKYSHYYFKSVKIGICILKCSILVIESSLLALNKIFLKRCENIYTISIFLIAIPKFGRKVPLPKIVSNNCCD